MATQQKSQQRCPV
jgi:hypothetical protein